MLIIYGSDQCPDCINCKADLDKAGVSYEYRSIAENLLYLKEFLAIRDQNSLFAPVKEAGKIGIPCLVEENGVVSLGWEQYL
jgi:glutaredoxin-related protein